MSKMNPHLVELNPPSISGSAPVCNTLEQFSNTKFLHIHRSSFIFQFTSAILSLYSQWYAISKCVVTYAISKCVVTVTNLETSEGHGNTVTVAE